MSLMINESAGNHVNLQKGESSIVVDDDEVP